MSMEQSNSPDLEQSFGDLEQSLEEMKEIVGRIQEYELSLVTTGERYYKTVRPLVYCLEWRRDVDEFVEDKFEEVEKYLKDLHTEWYKEKKGDGNPSIRTMEIVNIPQPEFPKEVQ